ncbi:MAG: DUF4123 domain-containing protein [Methylococcaceae bacterium]|nr:DUF4123 domain-containing protein [Methylococcaceae bacterium]
MSQQPADRLLPLLFPENAAPGRSVWAVLDAARDEQIFPGLRLSGLDYLCLYSGQLPPELQTTAPYLLELPPTSQRTRDLLNRAWGNAWGIFLSVNDPSNLRHHLRQFLRVQDETGRKLIFRYYDPRVLRVFLPTCDMAQLHTLFGPIRNYWAEGSNGEHLMEYCLKKNGLGQQEYAFKNFPEPLLDNAIPHPQLQAESPVPPC